MAEDWKRRSDCGLVSGYFDKSVTTTNLEVLSDLSHQALEGQLADEELSALLIATDLTRKKY